MNVGNVLYEEDGALKVGAVLSAEAGSLQVESPHGKRSKIKADKVLFDFKKPAAAELLSAAQQAALWRPGLSMVLVGRRCSWRVV